MGILDPSLMTAIADFIKQFGFATLVALWSLWQLTESLKKNVQFESMLKDIAETLDDIKDVMDKNSQIQNEILNTLKIFNILLTKNGGGIT